LLSALIADGQVERSGEELRIAFLVHFIQPCITTTLDLDLWLAFLERGLDTQGYLGNRFRNVFHDIAVLAFIILDLL
jgi:hypothetical protein